MAAVNAANGSGGGTIDLAPKCRYTFVVAVTGTDDALPPVTSPITVHGQGATVARSQAHGTPAFRLFEIASGGNLTLDNLTITGGSAEAEEAGSDQGNGGGILNNGTATLTGTRITDNRANFVGGGIANRSDNADLNVDRSVVSRNAVSNHAQLTPSVGGAGVDAGGTVVVSNTSVTDNSATTDNGVARGGGIFLETSATLRLSNSPVSRNSVNQGTAQGGGIFNAGGAGEQLLMSNSPVTGNSATGQAGEGGGILNGGSATLLDSPVLGNTTMGLSVVSGTGNGGGIKNKGTLSLTNSPLTGNMALDPAQGASGGGLANAGSATLVTSPVTGNRAVPPGRSSEGGGIFNGQGGSVTLSFSPVVRNVPDNCSPAGSVSGCTG